MCLLIIFLERRNPTWFFKDIWSLWDRILPQYGGHALCRAGIVPSADYVTQSSPRVLWTRRNLSSLVFLSCFPSPPWWCCTKTLLSGNTGLSSKSKYFQEKTWKSIFSVSTPLCPQLCHLVWLVIKLPIQLLIQFISGSLLLYLSKPMLNIS